MDTIIEILIDNSNSMGPFEADKGNTQYLLPDGSSRMELAKKILMEDIVPKLDYARKITIRKFHSLTYSNKPVQPVVETVYSGDFDKIKVLEAINTVPIPKNTGGTPITAAVKTAINELAKYPNDDRKIILITDGQETDGGDYKKTAEEALNRLGITCSIFIIGIAQDQVAEKKAESLATATGGTYINLKTNQYERDYLQNKIRPIYFNVVTTSLKTVANIPIIREPQTTNTAEDESPVPIVNNIIADYEKMAKNNSLAISLISKQLQSLTEAIESLQKKNSLDEDIVINENAELNEKIRLASEGFLFDKLTEKFGSRLKWVNKERESGLSYDFEVSDTLDNTPEFFIECKASMHFEKVFYLTKNEWIFLLQNKNKYLLFFVSEALTNPKLIKIGNLFDAILERKVIPFSNKNIKLKADRLLFSIVS